MKKDESGIDTDDDPYEFLRQHADDVFEMLESEAEIRRLRHRPPSRRLLLALAVTVGVGLCLGPGALRHLLPNSTTSDAAPPVMRHLITGSEEEVRVTDLMALVEVYKRAPRPDMHRRILTVLDEWDLDTVLADRGTSEYTLRVLIWAIGYTGDLEHRDFIAHLPRNRVAREFKRIRRIARLFLRRLDSPPSGAKGRREGTAGSNAAASSPSPADS